jgi:hypothetical protein
MVSINSNIIKPGTTPLATISANESSESNLTLRIFNFLAITIPKSKKNSLSKQIKGFVIIAFKMAIIANNPPDKFNKVIKIRYVLLIPQLLLLRIYSKCVITSYFRV